MDPLVSVDIQMPVKKGSYVCGEVISAFLKQTIDWEIYINAKDESNFLPPDKTIIGLVSDSPESMEGIEKRIQIARKRNELIEKGVNSYVYLADADVLLNDDDNSEIFNEVFYELIMGLERHPRVGVIGLTYFPGYHVGAGSMMLRRSNLPQIGEIKGVGSFCTCGYISHKLLQAGLFTVPLTTIKAKHIKMDNSADDYDIAKEENLKVNKDKVDIDSEKNIIHIFFTGGDIYHTTRTKMNQLLGANLGKDYMQVLPGYKFMFHPLQPDPPPIKLT
jgi:hypothetical protein